MHVQLFVSEHAPGGNRLLTLVRDAMPGVPFIQYHGVEAVGRVVPIAYDEKIIALIMVAGIEELVMLARGQNLWARSKTVLVLPSNEPEIILKGHALRPVYTAFSDGDFNNVISVMTHIRSRLEGRCRTPENFRE